MASPSYGTARRISARISTAGSDIVEARYVDIVPNDRVVQAVGGGSRVEITADDVPDGISADDHAAGLTFSLENLASYVES